MNVFLKNTISPYEEMLAYETLWGQQNQTLKSLATLFKKNRVVPSHLLQAQSDFLKTSDLAPKVERHLSEKRGFSVSVHGDFSYPERLQQAKYPVELFYYKGDIGVLDSRCVSVVGSRKCSEEGKIRTQALVTKLVEHGLTIVSGLAVGVDTAALKTAIAKGGKVVGVIGTPIDEYYPRENRDLQDEIANKHLLVSQVPFYRYATEPFRSRRNYFPQRNETMSALSEATIIVEASDTSGTLTQARACLEQRRKLFILNSCFLRTDISWPRKFEQKGAIRVNKIEDVLEPLNLR
jgi:DNA processing protein